MRAHECVKDIKKDKKRRNGVFKRPLKPFDHLEKMKLRIKKRTIVLTCLQAN